MAGNMRRRILVLLRLFEKETDERHTLTMPEILKQLTHRGIEADRRAIYEDIEELNNMGYEIIREFDGKRGYFLASRLFEDAEIAIIAANIRASRFLSEQKTARIMDKLSSLASPQYRRNLTDHRYRLGIPKSENNNVLYYVDHLASAISERRAVSFYYYRLDYRKRREFLNDGQPYTLYPEELLWRNENYYLLAVNRQGEHYPFRVDRMSELRILDAVRDTNCIHNADELKNYVRSTFSLEKGRRFLITLLCEKNCADEILECFGMNTVVYAVTDTHFKADISVAPGMQFYSWVFSQNGKVRVLQPENVKMAMQALCKERYLEYE